MSYEIGKSLKIDEKNNKIFVTSGSNNVYPKTYKKWEVLKSEPDFYKKVGRLVVEINNGGIHFNSLYKVIYAMYMTCKELGYQNCYTGIALRGKELDRETFNQTECYFCKEELLLERGRNCYQFRKEPETIKTKKELTPDKYIIKYGFYTEYYPKQQYLSEEERVDSLLELLGKTFMKYYKRQIKGKYRVLILDTECTVRGKSKSRYGGYYYRGGLSSCEEDLMDYHKAFYMKHYVKKVSKGEVIIVNGNYFEAFDSGKTRLGTYLENPEENEWLEDVYNKYITTGQIW